MNLSALSSPQVAIAIGFLGLGFAHSWLGERDVIRPLLRATWRIKGIPRPMADRLLRFAWHLTSLPWLALAALGLGAPLWPTIALSAVASAALVFFSLRAHLAWPIFLTIALAALVQGGAFAQPVLLTTSVVAAVVLLLAALIHVYWAFGGTWGAQHVIPTRPRQDAEPASKESKVEPVFSPPAGLTLLVAIALTCAAALLLAASVRADLPHHRLLLGLAVAVFALRAVGDGRYAGFTKNVRSTQFARMDDQLFTPLCVLFALGSLSAFWLTNAA